MTRSDDFIRKRDHHYATASTNPEAEEAIRRRLEFYTSETVDNFIKKHGVPKTRVAMQNLVSLANGKADPDKDTVELMSYVYFQTHSQQVNIRDKANGKLIVSIRK
ncbi:MAG TPA: hypothetical protein VJ792_03480 [Candidatus Nitrosotalea sp.]|nr:hypothetical protein [Candidatus Nitrosotalea sp.]